MNFDQLNISAPILRAISDEGYVAATPIQQQAIPIVLAQKDIIGCAQTGTGKTAAFAIPILQLLDAGQRRNAIRALIITPTRELAIQIDDSFSAYGRHLKLKHLCIFGGVPQGKQVTALKAGVDILTATPGRLLDLIQQGYINTSGIEILVLDEADRMLDMGFIRDVKKIVAGLPVKRQTLLFSATMPGEIRQLAKTILHQPAEVSVTPVSSTAQRINQSVVFVEKKEKPSLLAVVLSDRSITRSLVFTRTKHGADKLVKQLAKTGIYAAAIHGNKSQNARQKALTDFRDNKIRVLVATDIAARGIDIDDLPHVVNYELPNIPETYVHRIGRTGRAGAEGTAISFCDPEERDDLKNIQKLIGFTVPVVNIPKRNEQITLKQQEDMSDSFAKKEKEKQKAKAKQDKAQKMQDRKANNSKGKSLEDMMAYLDADGNITNTPPDDTKRREISLDEIQLGAAPIIPEEVTKTGVVSFFNEAKGYGFITEDRTRENVFVHTNQLLQPIKEKDRVSYEKERTPKGYSATKVKKI
jgi:ATP-dependent RNA helicase RhlE